MTKKKKIKRRLVLASASPRRLDILYSLGLDPAVVVVDAVELTDRKPDELIRLNGEIKAKGALPLCQDGDVVVAADTVVVCEGEILGKPKDAADAQRMLSLLSGRSHWVYTGVAVFDYSTGTGASGYTKTEVQFAELSPEVIEAYIQTGEPLDKAGAYGIQGRGGVFVKSISGDYGTVVGLSPHLFAILAAKVNFPIF